MALTLATALRADMLTALVGDIDGGGAAGTLDIYAGDRPTGPDTAVPGGATLLASVTLEATSFDVSGGTATLQDPAAVQATADGTAAWFRISASDSTAIVDGNVGTTTSDDLQLATVNLTSGLTVDITGGTIDMPPGSA